MDVKDYLLSMFETTIDDFNNTSEYVANQTVLKDLIEGKDKNGIKTFFDSRYDKHPKLAENKEKIDEFLNVLVFTTSNGWNKYINELYHIEIAATDYFKNNKNGFIKLDYPLNIDELNMLNEHVWKAIYDSEDELNIPFFITPSHKIDGVIAAQINQTKKVISVGSGRVKNGIPVVRYMWDEVPRKGYHNIQNKIGFYVYEFFGDDQKRYVLLSPEALKTERGTAKGILFGLSDNLKVGDSTAVKSGVDIMIIHSFDKEINNISKSAFKDITKDWNYEYVGKKLFGKYRQIKWFEKMLVSLLVAYDIDGFPPHLGVIGPAGTGKSEMLECLQIHYNESNGIFSGDGTIKGLVPSFHGAIPDPGHFVLSNRLCMCDEFLNILKATNGENINSIQTKLQSMNDMLCHHERVIRTGKGSILVHPTAQFIFSTNPLPRFASNIVELSDKISIPFLSRILIYQQTDEHVNYILQAKKSVRHFKKESARPKKWNDFVSVADYLKGIKLEVDCDKVYNLYEKYLDYVPEQLQEVYKGRYDHHLFSLVDGIGKINSIYEKREKLCILDSDYEEAEKIWAIIISSWYPGKQLIKNLPLKAREGYLKPHSYEIYCKICAQPGMEKREIREIFEGASGSFEYYLSNLIDSELAVIIEDRYYPYWHIKVKELNRTQTI
ncbi:MAG: hypothetical protein ACTSXD_08370 [Candidatus Heimdallarchaeaceae archaeon]